jgi:hypothetical protein
MSSSRRTSQFRTFVFQRRAAIAAIVVVVIVATSAIYVAARILEESRERTYQCVYTLVITPAGDDEYTVCVPIPCTWSDGIPAVDFAQDIIVTGNVVVGVEGTPYGPALKVEGTGRAELNWSSSSSGEDYGYYTNLTMVTDAEPGSLYDNRAWVSSDQESVSAYLDYSASNLWYPKPWFSSGSDRHYRIVMDPGEVGWRLVECEFEWQVDN